MIVKRCKVVYRIYIAALYHRAMAWTVYILKCRDDSLYTGITNDLSRRLTAHDQGSASRYTRSRLPVELAWSEPSADRSTALKREAEIKKLSRSAKMELIRRRA